MSIPLIDLPYQHNALEPYISADTIEYHFGKHYKGYVETANHMLSQKGHLATKNAKGIIEEIAGDGNNMPLFNNVAQAWNHEFFWQCMKPSGGGEPDGDLYERLRENYGSIGQFKDDFKKAAMAHFGSGWLWVAMDGETPKLMKTLNADTPYAHGLKPILTLDLWEHAYYLDYQNRRTDYIEAFLEHLVNWEFVSKNIK